MVDKNKGANIRLNKFISSSGVSSRREADRLITDGKVKVNNRVVTELGVTVDPAHDIVKVGSKVVSPRLDHVYVILNKPRGVLTTAQDTHDRTTVLDIVKIPGRRLFPVGRLDRLSEGLLLLTDDGDLALRLTHPRYEEEKEYKVWVDGSMDQAKVERLRKGVNIDGKLTLPAWVWLDRRSAQESVLKIRLREGRNRQIRLMCEAVGHPVRKLIRVKEGPLILGGLRSGDWRQLSPPEAERLRKAVGLA